MRLLLIIFLIGFTSAAVGQFRTVSGKVIGSQFRAKKDNGPYEFWDLSGARVFWKDSLLGTVNNKGQFTIELPKSIDVIRIGYIGMYPDTIHITGNCDHLEIILLPDAIHDFETLKKEQRHLKKERAILPKLYKKAFEQGIFRQEKPCR